MKINVTQKLAALNGEEIRIITQACQLCGRPTEEKGIHTLRSVCTTALLASTVTT